ncbi:Kelch repeat-containing protein [Phytophthora cinnamomi]|uniref:Kelch repeat-containing protein n=1 Tax=Phytophthora cinnamomi TaxID=4785 RepID=UPI00355A6113|nr:Kelch repeat-containing protein [Phytophthora cinnamomi]
MSQAALAAWVKAHYKLKRAPAQSTVSDILKKAALIDLVYTNVRVEFLPPNTTTFLQPMDAGIIALFKRAYRRRQLLWVYEKVKDVKKLKKESYAVDQLQAMRWSKEIWQELQGKSAIENCFRHTGIVFNGVDERAEDAQLQASDVQWKRLVVSLGSSQSPRSPLFRSGDVLCSGVARRAPCLSHPGGGRDYHSMHYVQSSAEDERAQGLRVLVVGNVVVASDDAAVSDTQAEAGAGAFDAPTLRVEELRVRQPTLEAQWEVRRVDAASMWKPRARHAHSSVVVGGDQVFVFGGKDASSSTFFNDIFYFDAPLNQWVKPAVNPTGQLPQPRAFAGLTASDDGNTLFLFGGTDGKQEFGSLFLYDVANARWDSLAGATLGDRPSCRINHSLTMNSTFTMWTRARGGWFTADTLKGREAVVAGVAKRLGMINLLSGEQHTLRVASVARRLALTFVTPSRVDAAAVYKQKLISIDGSHATYPTNTSLC